MIQTTAIATHCITVIVMCLSYEGKMHAYHSFKDKALISNLLVINYTPLVKSHSLSELSVL